MGWAHGGPCHCTSYGDRSIASHMNGSGKRRKTSADSSRAVIGQLSICLTVRDIKHYETEALYFVTNKEIHL